MTLSVLLVLVGLLMLGLGAEALVRASSSLALRLGVTPLVVSLTVVALGTSSPELVVSVEAALEEQSEIALGNVVGSNISNIALILGVAALVCPLAARAEVLRREMPITLGVSVLLWLLILDGDLGRIDGAILLGGCLAYLGWNYFASRQQPQTPEQTAETEAAARPLWLQIVGLVGGIALLVVGAKLLIDGALVIATYFRLSPVVIGLTLVAIGTSLPELATALSAAYKRETDVVLGGVIGSNILNILFILGLTAVIHPVAAGQIRALDLGLMLGSVALLWLLMSWRGTLERWGGAILLGGYAIYLYTLVS